MGCGGKLGLGRSEKDQELAGPEGKSTPDRGNSTCKDPAARELVPTSQEGFEKAWSARRLVRSQVGSWKVPGLGFYLGYH